MSAEAVAEIVERTSGTPLSRRRVTATRIVVTLSSDPRPPCVGRQIGSVTVPVLGLDAVTAQANAETAAAVRTAACFRPGRLRYST